MPARPAKTKSTKSTPKPAAKRRKNPAAVALGRQGGKARSAKLSKKRRSDIARKAALTRWG